MCHSALNSIRCLQTTANLPHVASFVFNTLRKTKHFQHVLNLNIHLLFVHIPSGSSCDRAPMKQVSVDLHPMHVIISHNLNLNSLGKPVVDPSIRPRHQQMVTHTVHTGCFKPLAQTTYIVVFYTV